MSYLSFTYMVSTVNLKLTYESKIPHEVFSYLCCQFWKQILIHSSYLLSFGLSKFCMADCVFLKWKKPKQTRKEKNKQNQNRNSTKYQKRKKHTHQTWKITARVSTQQAIQPLSHHKGNLKNQKNCSNFKKFPPDFYACGKRKRIRELCVQAEPCYSSTILDAEN